MMSLVELILLLSLLIIPTATQVDAFLVATSSYLSARFELEPVSSFASLTLCQSTNSNENFDLAQDSANEGWELLSRPYVSPTVKEMDPVPQSQFLVSLDQSHLDPLWEQVKLEASKRLLKEPSAGPQIYTRILSQPSLLHALTSIVSHEIEDELMPATSLQNLFFETLDPRIDPECIALDVMASTMRGSPSRDAAGFVAGRDALTAVLFHQGLHALVCHRLSHRLYTTGRRGLACHVQSTLSRRYSADIHPAAEIGPGCYLNAGSAGVVIGETAVVERDVTILQGVTLGGTGKETGDRHPKISRGALLQHSCSVLGNIRVGEGAIVTAKSIVTKPVPELARVSGVPAKVKSYRKEKVKKKRAPEVGHYGFGGSTYGYGGSAFVEEQEMDRLEVEMRNKYLRYWRQNRDL